ncbi:MAG: hypothetical protein JSU63_06795 [Phycisphaerales bacterium]|nr:MAG: hypothetical protein JSU63_06795 [Phycisphaerales bacterium]
MSEHHEDHHADDHTGHRHRNASAPLLMELREHAPFSISSVAIGLIVAGALCILGSQFPEVVEEASGHDHGGDHGDHAHGPPFARLFFHLFHPAHMFFSAAATTAMYVRYERKIAKAIIVGLVGAIGVCGISDIVMPHISLAILGAQPPWHICVIENPSLVLPFAAVGVLVGIATAGAVIRSTLISHSLHVLMSTMASIFYMVGPLGLIAWIDDAGKVFVFVVIAVMLPCCASDIAFPMLMTSAGRSAYDADGCGHCQH